MCMHVNRNMTSDTTKVNAANNGDPRNEILHRIGILLDKNPQMRFGQLISNIFRPVQYSGNPRFDCYSIPDGVVIEYIKNFEAMQDYLKKKDEQE